MKNERVVNSPQKKTFKGFGGYCVADSSVIRADRFKDVINSLAKLPIRSFVARGAGYSYGDAALNSSGAVILTERLNRMLSFDEETGFLRAESGVRIDEVFSVIIPRGWILPVVPGFSNITLGGCVAFDIHSKNHWKEGGFSEHVTGLRIVLADTSVRYCSREVESELFWATIAGMGLTGVIVEVELKLRRIEAPCFNISSTPVRGIEEILVKFDEVCPIHDFAVTWVDLLSLGNFGRGIMFAADYSKSTDDNGTMFKDESYGRNKSHLQFPLKSLAKFFTRSTNRMLNSFYYTKHAKNNQQNIVGIRPFLFPWDSIPYWNQLYGRNGFVEYQCVVPRETAVKGLSDILEHVRLQNSNYPVYFAAIKRMGLSKAPLSFPIEGYGLLMDFPVRPGLWRFLEEIDEILIRHKGRVFLAKDGRVSASAFRRMYPELDKWLKVKQSVDPKEIFVSDMSRRLALTG